MVTHSWWRMLCILPICSTWHQILMLWLWKMWMLQMIWRVRISLLYSEKQMRISTLLCADDFNLIVLGSPQENSLTSALLDAVPLSYDAGNSQLRLSHLLESLLIFLPYLPSPWSSLGILCFQHWPHGGAVPCSFWFQSSPLGAGAFWDWCRWNTWHNLPGCTHHSPNDPLSCKCWVCWHKGVNE